MSPVIVTLNTHGGTITFWVMVEVQPWSVVMDRVTGYVPAPDVGKLTFTSVCVEVVGLPPGIDHVCEATKPNAKVEVF